MKTRDIHTRDRREAFFGKKKKLFEMHSKFLVWSQSYLEEEAFITYTAIHYERSNKPWSLHVSIIIYSQWSILREPSVLFCCA